VVGYGGVDECRAVVLSGHASAGVVDDPCPLAEQGHAATGHGGDVHELVKRPGVGDVQHQREGVHDRGEAPSAHAGSNLAPVATSRGRPIDRQVLKRRVVRVGV
jgi:hypothetical protein